MKTGLLRQPKNSTPAGKRIAAVALGVLSLAFIIPAVAGIRINESPSLPIGLYVISEESGQLVEFCPAEPFASLAMQRAYRSSGNCPDGGAPLMKPEVAHEGDIVELNFRGVAVNGKLLLNSAPLSFDTAGRPLPHWPFGRFDVPSDKVWVISSYNLRSFDSRYIGPVSKAGVRHHLRSVLTVYGF